MNQHFRKLNLREDFSSQEEKREKQLGYRKRSFKEQQEIAALPPAPYNPVETLCDPSLESEEK